MYLSDVKQGASASATSPNSGVKS